MSAPDIAGCRGLGGFLFGHHYEPRFSVTERPIPMKIGALDCSAEALREFITTTDRMYHGDVCTRCGHTVNRPAEVPHA